MYRKKLIIVFLFIFFIANLSSIYAIEINDNNTIQNEPVQEFDLNLSSKNAGSFTDLENEISNFNETLILTKDYTYDENEDSSLQGIYIKKSIKIEGNGHTISGNNISKIFIVTANNVILKNINFNDGYNSKNLHGSAITWQGNNGKLINSNFTNNVGYVHSTVYWDGLNGEIINCNFKNNYQINGAGAIMWQAKNGKISNSNFIDNYAYATYASSITWYGDNGMLENCSFINNNRCDVNTILWSGKNSILYNCYFENNTANNGAGIHWRGSGNITRCTFINNLAKKQDGGGIYLFKTSDYFLKDCIFINNSAVGNGGAVYGLDLKKSSNCSFINNKEHVEEKEWYNYNNMPYEYGKITTIHNLYYSFPIDFSIRDNITSNIYLTIKTINGGNVANGCVELYINNKKYNATVKNGACSIEITLPAEIGKEYACNVIYLGYKDDGKKITYLTSRYSFNIKTAYKPTIDSIKTIKTNVNNQTNITATIHSDMQYYQEGIITININGKDYVFIKSNGFYKDNNTNNYIYNITLPFYFKDEGTYEFNITCNPILNYLENKKNIKVMINDPKELHIKLSSNTILLGQSVTLKCILTNSKGGVSNQTLRLSGDYLIDSNEYLLDFTDLITNSKGEAEYSFNFKKNGIYSYFIDNKPFKIIVQSPTKIMVNQITSKRSSIATLSVKIKDYLDGGYIQTTINGKSYNATVNKGIGTIKFKMPSKIGKYTYKVTYYPKSQIYRTSTTNFKVISKIGTKITIKSVSGIQGKKVKLSAIVKDDKGNKINRGNVNFNINGKTYVAKVKNGIASINIKYPKAKFYKTVTRTKGNIITITTYYQKTYNCKVSFNVKGDYLKTSSTFKITSKKKLIVSKYRYYKYKIIVIPFKSKVNIYNKGKIGVIINDLYYEDTHVIAIGAKNKKTNTPLKISTQLHYKSSYGKWYWDNSWEPYQYYDGLPMVIYFHNLDLVNKIKIRYYAPHYKRIN